MRQFRGQERRISGSIRLDRVRKLAVFYASLVSFWDLGSDRGLRCQRSEFAIDCFICQGIADITVYPLAGQRGCLSELDKMWLQVFMPILPMLYLVLILLSRALRRSSVISYHPMIRGLSFTGH